MHHARRLVLKKESLTELGTDELVGVAAGAITPHCPSWQCYPTWHLTCRISDVLAECPSLGGC